MDIWILCGRYGDFWGAFETVEQAFEYVYLSYVYQVYRGYSGTVPDLLWRDTNGWRYSAYPEVEGMKTPQYRGAPLFIIQKYSVPSDHVLAEDLKKFAAHEKKTFPNFADWLQIWSANVTAGEAVNNELETARMEPDGSL